MNAMFMYRSNAHVCYVHSEIVEIINNVLSFIQCDCHGSV